MKASYSLRVPEELGRKIREEADRYELSVNQYILYTLTKEISRREAERELKRRIRNAPSGKEALRILEAIVPDVVPLKVDRIAGLADWRRGHKGSRLSIKRGG